VSTGFGFEPQLAFAIGAHIALLFSLALLVRARRLTAERISRVGAWRVLEPHERLAGEAEKHQARDSFKICCCGSPNGRWRSS
jgi:hypothetical protein